MTARKYLDTIYRFLSKRVVYHSLFWIVLFFIMLRGAKPDGVGWGFILSNELIGLSFYALLVYFNLFYLIPNYLARHAIIYLGLVLAVCAIVTPIEVLVLYLKFDTAALYRERLVEQQANVYIGNVFVTLVATVLLSFHLSIR